MLAVASRQQARQGFRWQMPRNCKGHLLNLAAIPSTTYFSSIIVLGSSRRRNIPDFPRKWESRLLLVFKVCRDSNLDNDSVVGSAQILLVWSDVWTDTTFHPSMFKSVKMYFILLNNKPYLNILTWITSLCVYCQFTNSNLFSNFIHCSSIFSSELPIQRVDNPGLR